MIHEKCGNELRYVTMYTVMVTKSVHEAEEEEDVAFIEVTNEEVSQTHEVYCNICNQKLNLHETEVVRHNLYAPEDADERADVKLRWERWQDRDDDE
jgi:hypothetical protein